MWYCLPRSRSSSKAAPDSGYGCCWLRFLSWQHNTRSSRLNHPGPEPLSENPESGDGAPVSGDQSPPEFSLCLSGSFFLSYTKTFFQLHGRCYKSTTPFFRASSLVSSGHTDTCTSPICAFRRKNIQIRD